MPTDWNVMSQKHIKNFWDSSTNLQSIPRLARAILSL